MRVRFAIVALLALSSCARVGPEPLQLHGTTMGTTWSVTVIADLHPNRTQVRDLVEQRLDLIDRLMSHYRRDSEVSGFNSARAASPFPISRETADVIGLALEISELTGGALDITIGPLVDAWGFGTQAPARLPPDEGELGRLLEVTGSDLLMLDLDASTVTKDREDLRIDLSSVAKGFAVDLVSEALSRKGHDRHMVEIGGEIRVSGPNPDGQPWRLAVEEPLPVGRELHRIVRLPNGALATSGDYRNVSDLGGQTISHIIDPRTGRPITHDLASVTVIDVIDSSCARADGFATALLVLGPDEGLALAEELGLAAMFLVRTPGGSFCERSTSAFDEAVSAHDTPVREIDPASEQDLTSRSRRAPRANQSTSPTVARTWAAMGGRRDRLGTGDRRGAPKLGWVCYGLMQFTQ